MAALNPPIYIQAGEYSARDDRLQVSTHFDRRVLTEGTFDLDRGVFPPQDQLEVYSPGGVGGALRVRPGLACIPQESYDPPGMYLIYNRGPQSLQLGTPNTKPRIDIVAAELLDLEQGNKDSVTNESNRWRFRIIQGAPDDNPRAPTSQVTHNMLELAHVTVRPVAATGGEFKVTDTDIVDRRQFISGLGGVHLYWSRLPDNSPGRLAYNVPSKRLLLSDGTAFNPVMTEASMAKYMEAYRPRQAYAYDVFYITARNNWITKPVRRATDVVLTTDIGVMDIASRAGQFRVSISGKLRVSNAGDAGHIGLIVRDPDNATKIAANWGRSPRTNNTQWTSVSHTMIYGGLPADTKLDFILAFGMHNAAPPATAGRLEIADLFLVVEPVI